MKKSIFAMLSLLVTFAVFFNGKSAAPQPNGGSWTFENNTINLGDYCAAYPVPIKFTAHVTYKGDKVLALGSTTRSFSRGVGISINPSYLKNGEKAEITINILGDKVIKGDLDDYGGYANIIGIEKDKVEKVTDMDFESNPKALRGSIEVKGKFRNCTK